MTMPPAFRRAVPHLMLAAFVLPTGLLHAQKAGKGQKQGSKDAAAAQPSANSSAPPTTPPAAQPAAPPFVPSPQTAPPVVTAQNGKVDAPLYAVFGEVNIPGIPPGIDPDGKIAVRSYALGQEWMKGKTPPSIPGPTFVFQPGDLLRLRFHNYLNRAADPALNAAQNNPQHTGPVGFAASSDDTDEHVSHEISIPNDSNVTNLHVHGLHVDPKQDDVTLLVLPEDNDPGALTPELQRFVPTINRWWTRTYQYKLPEDHLPGTYWYHSHKHGSTSSQVENGMAGTLIIRPDKEEDDPVPGLWASGHDRIMMIQELANYSTPSMLKNDRKGKGQGQGSPPVTTVNGLYQPVLQLPPGQVERWRFIVAGANHTTSSYIWAGCIQPQLSPEVLIELSGIKALLPNGKAPKLSKPANFTCLPLPGKVKLIALDGITMWQSRDITPQAPAFGSAGNRLDLLVQVDPGFKPDGNIYRIYQNYPVPPAQDIQASLAANPTLSKYAYLFDSSSQDADLVNARIAAMGTNAVFANSAGTKNTPNLGSGNIPTDTYLLGTSYNGFKPTWVNVDEDGCPIAGSAAPSPPESTGPNKPNGPVPVVPLLKGKDTDYNGVDINDENCQKKFADGETGWQSMPDAGGGFSVAANALVTLNISGQATGPTAFPKDLDGWLSAHSPAGSGSALQRVDPHTRQLEPGIPQYVSPMPDDKIAGAQVAVFDRGQFTFSYVDKASQKLIDVRQFWINGRQFNVDDWIGNPASPELNKNPLQNVEPSLGAYSPNAAAKAWTHKIGSDLLVTNPGYFLPIKKWNSGDPCKHTPVTLTDSNGYDLKEAYNYDYTVEGKSPTYEAITGLKARHTPVSTTAEEWLLVNNSDLFHPFHIHINPFFVTEIGQLNYTPPAQGAPSSESGTWSLKKITLGQKADTKVPFSWVVGNWWDVITIPPHGYVKFRMWINVPTQHPVDKSDPDSDLVVTDNSNTYGSWVFHCHILRHEDRGMMLMVNTRPKEVNLSGTWARDDKGSYTVTDNHGGLTIQPSDIDVIGENLSDGTFSRGVGNALYSQPFLGSLTDRKVPAPPPNPPVPNPVPPKPPLPTPQLVSVITAFCLESSGNRMLLSNGHFLSRNNTPAPEQPSEPNLKLSLKGTWVDNQGNIATIEPNTIDPTTLTFKPTTPVWWKSGTAPVPAPSKISVPPAESAPVGYIGYTSTLVVENNAGQNQLLTFCISRDFNTLVFSNGITWTRAKP